MHSSDEELDLESKDLTGADDDRDAAIVVAGEEFAEERNTVTHLTPGEAKEIEVFFTEEALANSHRVKLTLLYAPMLVQSYYAMAGILAYTGRVIPLEFVVPYVAFLAAFVLSADSNHQVYSKLPKILKKVATGCCSEDKDLLLYDRDRFNTSRKWEVLARFALFTIAGVSSIATMRAMAQVNGLPYYVFAAFSACGTNGYFLQDIYSERSAISRAAKDKNDDRDLLLHGMLQLYVSAQVLTDTTPKAILKNLPTLLEIKTQGNLSKQRFHVIKWLMGVVVASTNEENKPFTVEALKEIIYSVSSPVPLPGIYRRLLQFFVICALAQGFIYFPSSLNKDEKLVSWLDGMPVRILIAICSTIANQAINVIAQDRCVSLPKHLYQTGMYESFKQSLSARYRTFLKLCVAGGVISAIANGALMFYRITDDSLGMFIFTICLAGASIPNALMLGTFSFSRLENIYRKISLWWCGSDTAKSLEHVTLADDDKQKAAARAIVQAIWQYVLAPTISEVRAASLNHLHILKQDLPFKYENNGVSDGDASNDDGNVESYLASLSGRRYWTCLQRAGYIVGLWKPSVESQPFALSSATGAASVQEDSALQDGKQLSAGGWGCGSCVLS